jgi:hypothetical protein
MKPSYGKGGLSAEGLSVKNARISAVAISNPTP